MILTICQPMLDKRIKCTKREVQSNNLNSNGYNEIMTNTSEIIKKIGLKTNYRLSPGGSSLNTIRCLLKKNSKEKLVYLGAIGDDAAGDYLVENLKNNKNFEIFLERIQNSETAECLVLINDHERSLVTKIGAANMLSIDFLETKLQYIYESDVVYLCAFFVSAMPENTRWILDQLKINQTLVFNLSYQSLFEDRKNKLFYSILALSSIIIGNKNEFEALYKFLYDEKPQNDDEMIFRISNDNLLSPSITETIELGFKDKIDAKTKTIICTDGEKDTLYGHEGLIGKVKSIKINKKVIDTCGAGDFFAAAIIGSVEKINRGFIGDVISLGHEWAHEFIIKNSKLLGD